MGQLYIDSNRGSKGDPYKIKEKVKYTVEEIREAVDIATGDDGFRSKEVISILETNVKQNTEEYLKEKEDA